MIVANFYFIKNTNGLCYYGIEYLKNNIDLIRLVLVSKNLAGLIKQEMPSVNIKICCGPSFLWEVIQCKLYKDLLFTPSSHPLPFINQQWVVMHDAFPFEGSFLSKLKKSLLKISLSLSKCKVGYINKSDSINFVKSLCVEFNRMVFAPNRFPEPLKRILRVKKVDGLIHLGLFGTDSEKKNYFQLLSYIRTRMLGNLFVFHFYGHKTNYFINLKNYFPDQNINLVSSDLTSLTDFLSRLDSVVSVARHEGFGRPIAFALMSGVRVELIDQPVFREFFSEGARLHPDIDSLIQFLLISVDESNCKTFIPSPDILNAFCHSTKIIRMLGTINQ
jgi:hypothetical protein